MSLPNHFKIPASNLMSPLTSVRYGFEICISALLLITASAIFMVAVLVVMLSVIVPSSALAHLAGFDSNLGTFFRVICLFGSSWLAYIFAEKVFCKLLLPAEDTAK